MQASGGQRVQAFLWDYLWICLYLIGLAGVSAGAMALLGGARVDGLLATPVRRDLLAFFTAVLPVWVYFAVGDGRLGGTWGKRRVGLGVVDGTGQTIGLGRSFLRSGIKFLPWQLAHTALFHIPGWPMNPGTPPDWTLILFGVVWLLVIVYLVGLFAFGRRTLYDRLSGTRVVERTL